MFWQMALLGVLLTLCIVILTMLIWVLAFCFGHGLVLGALRATRKFEEE